MLINILSRFLIKLSRYLTKCIKRFLKKTKSKSSKSRKTNPITLKSEQVIKKPTQKPQTNSVKSKKSNLKLANTLFEDEKLLLKQASSDLHKSIKKLKPFEKNRLFSPKRKRHKNIFTHRGNLQCKILFKNVYAQKS